MANLNSGNIFKELDIVKNPMRMLFDPAGIDPMNATKAPPSASDLAAAEKSRQNRSTLAARSAVYAAKGASLAEEYKRQGLGSRTILGAGSLATDLLSEG